MLKIDENGPFKGDIDDLASEIGGSFQFAFCIPKGLAWHGPIVCSMDINDILMMIIEGHSEGTDNDVQK